MDITFSVARCSASAYCFPAAIQPPPHCAKSAATVLDGKTMGTFWRVSVIGVDEAKAETLRQKVGAARCRRSPALHGKTILR